MRFCLLIAHAAIATIVIALAPAINASAHDGAVEAGLNQAARLHRPLYVLVSLPDAECPACRTVHTSCTPLLRTGGVYVEVPSLGPAAQRGLRVAVATYPTLIVIDRGKVQVYAGLADIKRFVRPK